MLLLAFGVGLAFALALPSLRVGFKVDGFFHSDDPELQRAMAHYGDGGFEPPDRLLCFAWSEAEPLSAESVARVQRFTALAQQQEWVARVLSLSTAQLPGLTKAEPAAIAASRTWRQLLVSRHGDAVAGLIVLRPGWDHDALLQLFDGLRTTAAAEGRELQLCGLPFHTAESRQLVRADMARFLPIGTAMSSVLLFWLVPHWLLALLALVVVPLTLVSTLGVMAMCGIELTMLTSTLPTLLLCMSIADGVHMVGRFLEERAVVADSRLAAARTFAAMFVPCLMTSLTTIVGFASLATASLVDLRWLGLFAALGMGFAFVFTMLILPAAMSFVTSAAGRRLADPANGLVRIALWCMRWPSRRWLQVAAVVTLVAGAFALQVRSDHRMTADLWPDGAVMRQLRFYEERFVGIVPAEVVVETERGFGVPERAQLAALCAAIEQAAGVSRTLSVADLFADGLSPLLVGPLAASGLLPAGLLSRDGRTARVLVFRGDLGTVAWNDFTAQVATLAAAAPELQVRLAGMQRVGTAQVQRMTDELAWSFASSFVLIFLLVWLQCRSVPLAGVAMVSCLLPMLCVLALMAGLGITLRPLTVIAFCIALGLMIDDAIHLVARWQEERRADRTAAETVRVTLATAGRPVVVTTLLLLVGFLTILGSEFRGTWTFGFLVVVSLVLALVAALVLVPALLVHVRPRA